MLKTQIFENELCDLWFIKNGEIRSTKIYRGIVVDNQDPLNQNRIKVYIPELMKEISGIWARPIYDFNKVAISPQVGDVVAVMFEAGNFQNPVYLGHIRLECSNSQEKACGVIQDKDQSPLDYWIIETPDGRRLRLSDSSIVIQLGSYSTNRVLEINDSEEYIKLQTPKNLIQLDDKNQKIIIKTEKCIVELDDSGSQIYANIGNSKVTMTDQSIQAEVGGSKVQIDSNKIMARANVIMLN